MTFFQSPPQPFSRIFAIAFFWCYGFYGALSGTFSVPATILFAAVFAVFAAMAFDENPQTDFSALLLDNFFPFLALTVPLLFFCWDELHISLTRDQIYHAQRSQLHGIILVQTLVKQFPSFRTFSFAGLLHFWSFAIVVTGFFALRLLQKLPRFWKAGVLSATFLIARLTIEFSGGYTDPHPPLRLLPLFLSGAVLGPSDFAFRFPQLLGLGVLGTFLYRQFRFFASKTSAWLAALVAISMPVLLHTSTLAEASIWTTVLWTWFLFSFSKGERLYEFGSFFKWVSVILVFTLLRQSSILLLPVLLLVMIVPTNESLTTKWRNLFARGKLWWLALPTLLTLPFFMKSLLLGTPSTTALTNIAASNPLTHLREAFATGKPFEILVRDLKGFCGEWIFFLAVYFLPWGTYFKVSQWIVRATFFGLAVLLFFSIPPGLWGLGRYQAEWLAPFAILGFFVSIRFLFAHETLRQIANTVLLVLFTCNLLQYKILPEHTRAHQTHPYRDALADVKKQGLASTLYKADITYGTFLEILNGYSVDEVLKLQDIYRNVCGIKKRWVMSCENEDSADIALKTKSVRAILSPTKIKISPTSQWKVLRTYEDTKTKAHLFLFGR